MIRIAMMILTASALAACTPSAPQGADSPGDPAAEPGQDAGAAFAPPEDAQQVLEDGARGSIGDDHDRMVAACLDSTNHEAPMCECVARRAELTLTPDAYAMALAGFEGDESAAASIAARLTLQEAASVATFGVNAFAACAREQAEP